MAVNPSPFGPKPQFELADGTPAVGGRLFFYVSGSSAKQNTYTDSTGGSANTNPLVFNALGMPTTEIWFTAGQAYTVLYAPPGSDDPPNSPIWTINGLYGINDTTSAQTEWIAGPTPTYIGATSFSLVGDQTATFQVGRRVRTTNTGGTVYSTIVASVFGAVTTVTVVNSSSTLDSGLSAVSYGLLSKTNDSMPRGVFPTMANVTSYMYGNTYANSVADVTNDIDVAAGGCIDSTGADFMLGTALTKQSDAVWAVGNAAGGLDLIGSAGNNDFYIWRIKRVDTQVVDALFSLSSTAPTMPANYTLKRLVGWIKRVAGAIVLFHTYETEGGGIEMNWDAPTLDVNLANTLTTARRTDAVKVPLNFSTIAHLNVNIYDATQAAIIAMICCPDQTDAAPSGNAAPLFNITEQVTSQYGGQQMFVRTSAAGLIAARSNFATVDEYHVATIGFTWARR